MTKKQKSNFIHYALLTLIIIMAVFLRVYQIDSAPAGIYPDEANNGTNAYDAQLSNNYQWFYPDNNGREGLYLNMMAIFFKFFGVSFLTLKLTSIVMGVLTVLGVYFLTKELFLEKRRMALIASYLTAVSFWAIMFSRIGFRAITMLPILTFSTYFLLRGIRKNKKIDYIIGGFIFGLGFHTYIAFRIAPLVFAVLIFFFILSKQNFLKKSWAGLLLFGTFAFVSLMPMLWTFQQHPEYLNSRTGDVSVFAENETPLTETLSKTIILSLAKFNFYGDQNWRHGYPPYPTLEAIVGLTFAIGLFSSIFIFFKLFYLRIFKKMQNRKLAIHAFLLAWFVGFLAPEFMTTEGLPHALRSIGVLPVVYIFSALTFDYILEHTEKYAPKFVKIVSIILIVILLFIGIFNVSKYHLFWARETQQAEAFNKPLTDIALFVQSLPAEQNKYVFFDGPLEQLPVRLLNEQKDNLFLLYKNEVNKINFQNNPIILTSHQDENLVKEITNQAFQKNKQINIHR
jgi:4-amino-4-deoxy-L-arabinose transferase-like glycosyltransferase